MPAELSAALDRFLACHSSFSPRARVRNAARTALEAWHDGRISTAQALAALDDCLSAARSVELVPTDRATAARGLGA